MTDKEKSLRIEINNSIDKIVNGIVHPHIEREKLAQKIVKLFAIPDVSKQSELLCDFFEPKNDSSSATICKHCGREKWMHPKAT